MNVPDELVRAAAEALDADDAPAWWWGEGPLQDAGVDSTLAARIALQAAFAKLGECEAARSVLVAAMDRSCGESGCTWATHDPACAAETSLAALAREFGGRE